MLDEIPHLRRYAWALLGRDAPNHADDLVQTCLERALSRAEQWQPGSRLRPWLFSILHNLHVSSLRQEIREYKALRERDKLTLTHRGQTDGQMEKDALAQALSELPFEQRMVFVLVSLEGFSYEETAEFLDIPIGTVRSRLARPRDGMADLLHFE